MPHAVNPEPAAVTAWPPFDPEPTNLLALHPGEEMPEPESVRAALAAGAKTAGLEFEIVPAPGEEIRWAAAVTIDALAAPIMLWTEPARPDAAGNLDDPAAAGCRWVIGAETILDRNDPLAGYATLCRLLRAAARGTPAILDVNCAAWHDRATLDRHFAQDGPEPPADLLWIIQAVESAGRGGDAEPVVWIHTHGLWRCGRVELEMLDVPLSHAPAAATLVNDLAALILEQETAAPGEPFEIGAGICVTLQPWEEAAAGLESGVPGSREDRAVTGDGAHLGVRAAICGTQPRGVYRALWTWPEETVRRLERGEATVYRSERASRRLARLSAATWPLFTRAARSDLADGALVKAAFEDARGGEQREHLWFAVREIDDSGVRGELLNDPLMAALRRGEVAEIDRARISEWAVSIDGLGFGPDDVDALGARLEQGGAA